MQPGGGQSLRLTAYCPSVVKPPRFQSRRGLDPGQGRHTTVDGSKEHAGQRPLTALRSTPVKSLRL